MRPSNFLTTILLASFLVSSQAWAQSFIAPSKGEMEVAFSPNEGSESLVLNVIRSSKTELLILAYSFTSAPITEAVLSAKKRGVQVRIVADHKSNIEEDRSGRAKAALTSLALAGIDVRTISKYQAAHDKLIISDRKSVELGSFNYSSAAANKNSELVLVNWNNPELAGIFIRHFERNYGYSQPLNLSF